MEENFKDNEWEQFPEELLANDEEQLMEYDGEEQVISTTTRFLNIEGAEFGAQVFNALKEGNIDPITTLIMIKKMNHLHDYFLGSDKVRTNKAAKEYLKDKISDIVGKTEYRAYGASIKIEGIGGATTVDFKECGDIYLNRLMELELEIKGLIKARQKQIVEWLPFESKTLGLRVHKDTINELPVIRMEVQDEQTFNIVPPIKYSREGIVVRFPKKR